VGNLEDRTSQNFVKKKAALTLLRLYRKHPEVIPAKEWALRIISIMDDPDLVSGYRLSSLPFATLLPRELCFQ
jgi:AP-2 complex subunit alpha